MILRSRLSPANPLIWMVLIVAVWLLLSIVGNSAPAARSYGEVLVARGLTVNGTPAGSGLTVISGGRIRTGGDGKATINLGRLGLVKLGPEAEMVINFNNDEITGELVSGWAVISSPKGVAVSVATRDGVARTYGGTGSMLTIDLSGGLTRVESKGEASIISGGISRRVSSGESLTVSRSTNDANPVFNRTPISAPAEGPRGGLFEAFGSSLRGAVRTIRLDRNFPMPRTYARNLVRSPEDLRLNPEQQQVTCPPSPCPGCDIDPDLVKARAKCTTFFVVRLNNVNVTSTVSVRPFFSNACFSIFPNYPTQVTIPPGGSAFYNIDGRFCPNNAGSLPQNSQLVIETNTCGKKNIPVEWAVPCR